MCKYLFLCILVPKALNTKAGTHISVIALKQLKAWLINYFYMLWDNLIILWIIKNAFTNKYMQNNCRANI